MTNDVEEMEIGDYSYLRNMGIEAWAWEFTRRSAAYKEAWKNHLLHDPVNELGDRQVSILDEKEVEAAAPFGLLFFRKPRLGLRIRPAVLVTIDQSLHPELCAHATGPT